MRDWRRIFFGSRDRPASEIEKQVTDMPERIHIQVLRPLERRRAESGGDPMPGPPPPRTDGTGTEARK